jgi:hypothetical protein
MPTNWGAGGVGCVGASGTWFSGRCGRWGSIDGWRAMRARFVLGRMFSMCVCMYIPIGAPSHETMVLLFAKGLG